MKKITNYFRTRIIAYTFITIFVFILPFIKINGNHLFLLSFDKKMLHLFFISFNTNELYLMPFLLIMMFVFIFFITNLLGRVWCAWGCPQTIFRVIFRDLIQTKIFKIYSTRENKQSKPKDKKISQILSIVIFYFISLVAASNFMWYFIPPEDFFTYIQYPQEHKILIGILIILPLFITFDIVFLKENFCVYICPYARIQSVMFDNDTKTIIYDEERGGVINKNDKANQEDLKECINCKACVRVCPTHIDIRKGMQLDCINCLECVDACSSIQATLNRPSLIDWVSTKELKNKEKLSFFRLRTITYIFIMCVMFVGFVYSASTKEKMLLNINRTSELYYINSKKQSIDNVYTILIHNTDNKKHKFVLEVLDDEISVVKPKKQIEVKPNQKLKKIVVLRSKENKDNIRNKHIKIKAFAVDDSEIFTITDTIFIYPKENEWKEKMN